ncbi:hypothetical protein N7470_003005 [Penicillium chermesinum]|nr:hypothetical protein N7470_003005 [Penicillium chermesinum]
MAASVAPTLGKDDELIECWDDDDDLQFHDGIQLRAASSAGSIDSNAGDEDWQVILQGHDEFAKEEALASAKDAGIPIPENIPNSALLGGVIKRLSSRKPKRTFVDDWSDDVELPGPDAILQLRTQQDLGFPDAIRHSGSTLASPVKSAASSWADDKSTRQQPALAILDRCNDENFTKMYHNASPIKTSTHQGVSEPLQKQARGIVLEDKIDDFDGDLELPPVHQPLRLSDPKDRTGVPSPILDEFDLEWAEGSIGVRVGGTARDGRSIPSSTISIASPSASSCITGGSDDGLDGLVFPDGPLDLTATFRKQQEAHTHEKTSSGVETLKASSHDTDDFFTGLEVDDGRAFVSGKLSLNPNVKCRTEWPASPTRRLATTLVFTNNSSSSPLQNTRIPRLSNHDRAHSTHSSHLETVSESGAPLSKFPRSQTRLGHASQSSISSLPAARTTFASLTSTKPGRQTLGSRTANATASTGEYRTPSRHLRTKRSLPSMQEQPLLRQPEIFTVFHLPRMKQLKLPLLDRKHLLTRRRLIEEYLSPRRIHHSFRQVLLKDNLIMLA